MSVVRFTTGSDVHVQQKYPNTPNADTAYPVLGGASGAAKRILVRPANLAAGLRGQTLLSLTVSVPVRGSSAAFSPTWALLASGFANTATWNRHPDVLSGGISRAFAAATDGQRVTADITPLGLQIAAGVPFYGFRVSTTATTDRKFYGYDSGPDSWIFEATISDDSDAPVSLEPDGGAIGLTQPILAWQADDGEPEDGIAGTQIAYRVQVDRPATGVAPDGASPDYDSGTVTSTVSQHNLAGTSFTAASGALTYWRAQTRDAGGVWSDWSDWASFTYRPKPSLTFNAPTGGNIYDPSPTVQVTSSLPIVAYRIVVTDAADPSRIRYDSRRQPWTDLAQNTLLTEEIPAKVGGVTVFAGGTSYKIDVSIEDRNDRVASPTDAASTTTSTTVSYSQGSEPAPTSLTATQTGTFPEVRLRWTRSSAADIWIIERNGSPIAEIEADESAPGDGQAPIMPDGAGAWTWLDRDAPAGRALTYTVRALPNGGQQSAQSPAATITPKVTGLWIVRFNGDRVVLDGDPDVSQSDRRVTYEGINAQASFDIIYAQLGLNGTFDGSVQVVSDQNLNTALDRLRAIRANPTQRVRLVWGEHNILAELIDVSVVSGTGDDGGAYRPNTRVHSVSFGIRQVAGFETVR